MNTGVGACRGSHQLGIITPFDQSFDLLRASEFLPTDSVVKQSFKQRIMRAVVQRVTSASVVGEPSDYIAGISSSPA